jgi:hypothetical protein
VSHIELEARLARDPVASSALAFLEHVDWCHDPYEQPVEACELAARHPSSHAGSTKTSSTSMSLPARGQAATAIRASGKTLTGRAGNDAGVLHPREALGGARAVLHPPLIDGAPERVNAQANPRLV